MLLSDLSPEILDQIVLQLYNEEDSTLSPLKTLSCVSQRFRYRSLPSLFRHVTLPLASTTSERCAGIIEFLMHRVDVRLFVKTITISIEPMRSNLNGKDNSLQQAFRDLLPLLSKLMHIRLRGGDVRGLHPSTLDRIQSLDHPVGLDIGSYTHTFSFEYLLDRVTCLESLAVNLLNAPTFLSPTSILFKSFDGQPSKEVSRIISQNKKLKRLRISLNGRSLSSGDHDLLAQEQDHALENIDPAVSNLQSLALEGYLTFTEKAWHAWDKSFGWKSLQSLAIGNHKLMEQIISHLRYPLPRLRTLALSANNFLEYLWVKARAEDLVAIDTFLANLNLTRLSLIGFEPKNVYALQQTGTTLRYLHIHQKEPLMVQGMLRGPGSDAMYLSYEHLEFLRATCTSLEWLAIDISRNALIIVKDQKDIELYENSHPQSAVSQSISHKIATHVSWSMEAGTLNLPRILETKFLNSISKIPSLCRLQVYLDYQIAAHEDETTSRTLNKLEVMLSFKHIYKQKEGRNFETLIINSPLSDFRYGSWRVSNFGLGIAILEHWASNRNDTVTWELWDLNEMVVLETKEGKVPRSLSWTGKLPYGFKDDLYYV